MLFNRAYYQLKPFLPLSLRVALRRWRARRRRLSFAHTWPIYPNSDQAPQGWPGWPDGKKFALVLTHDVEGQRGLDRSRVLMEQEARLGFRSSFNFVPEGDYRLPRELRETLTAAGFEVGVHDLNHDGKLYRNRDGFRANAQVINRYLQEWNAVGFRSGFMHHNLDWLGDLNALYDASTFDTDPFEPQPDGVQTIFPFWVPGPHGRGYVELPYSLVQDYNLFVVLQEKTIDVWKRKLDWIASRGGMALLIVHPDYMNFSGTDLAQDEFPASLYEQFLRYAQEKYAGLYWQALPREVAHYVREHKAGCRNPHLELAETEPAVLPLPAPLPGEAAARQNDASSHLPAETSPRVSLRKKRAAVVVFSQYPADPRPRRSAEALAKQGMTVDVICLGGDDPRRETFNDVNIYRVPFQKSRGGKFGYAYQYSVFILAAFAILAFRSLFRRYHLVHVHNMPDVLVFSALVPKILGAKVILDLHDPMPELMMTIFGIQEEKPLVRLLKRLEKWSIGFADKALTVNLASKRIFTSRSCAPAKIDVIMNSPDEKIFGFAAAGDEAATERKRGTPFILMYHGTLVERNGLDLAVDALEKVRAKIPNIELRIYGASTPYVQQVMASVEQRGLQSAVRYFGSKNLEQIVAAIAECDLGVIPNRRNVFTEMNTPTRIFEYLTRGKPLIAPQAQGITDYFTARDLIYFQLGDVEDLARQIEWAYFNPDGVNEVLRRGQEICREHRWNQESQRLVGAVGELLKP